MLLESRRLKHELRNVAYLINTKDPPLLLLENDLDVMGYNTYSIVPYNQKLNLGILKICFRNFEKLVSLGSYKNFVFSDEVFLLIRTMDLSADLCCTT